ncbi:MAG: glycosyltransferase family 4 protein [Planctomycetota bacterium]
MKIAYVVHQFFPRHITGTETYTFELAASMKERGYEVSVLCYEHSTSKGVPRKGVLHDEYNGLPVTRFCYDSRKWKEPALYEYYNPEFGEMSLDYFGKEKPDIVHFTHNALLSTSLIDSAGKLGLPIMLTLTDFWYICPQMQLIRGDSETCEGPEGCLRCLDCYYLASGSDITAPLRRLLPERLRKKAEGIREAIRKKIILTLSGKDRFIKTVLDRPNFLKEKMSHFDVVVAPTVFLRDTFVKAGYNEDRFRVINFGINLGLLDGVEKREAPRLRLGFVGTLREHKGPHLLLQALRKLERDDIEVAIYGSEKQFPEYAARLRALAGDDRRVRFCGTFPREDIGKVLAEMDVLVMPSLWHENSPLMLLYALASRTPVIASDSGGLSEFIEDGVSGLLFGKGDVSALAARIERLAADRDFTQRLSEAPVSVKSIDAHSDEIEGIYRELIAAPEA